MLHRYLLGGVSRKGEIISYLEEIVNEFTETQLYEKYGYLMEKRMGMILNCLWISWNVMGLMWKKRMENIL